MDPALHQLQHEIASALSGLDAAQTQLRPTSRPNKWSIQQIMEHLLLSYSATELALSTRLVKGTPTRAKPVVLQRCVQYTLINLGYFPTGRKAPPLVTPPATIDPLSGKELVAAAAERLTGIDTLCVEVEKLFGPTCRCASHMVLGPLTANQWRRFQLIHGEHHLKQIDAIRGAHNL